MSLYITFLCHQLFLALIATLMVKYSAEKVTFRSPSTKPTNGVTPSGTQSTIAKNEDIPPPKPQTKIAYYSAGSGIPEVKVILAGFVIKGFLGIKTLFVKSVGMVIANQLDKPRQ